MKIRDIVDITGVLPCDVPHLYYQGNGQIIEENLNDFLGEYKKDVVAWFKFRRHRKFGYSFTLRERILHEEFIKFFNISPNMFTCCLLTYGISPNGSTHVYQHAFVNYFERQMHITHMNIENLSDPCHEYLPNKKASEAFMKLFNKIDKNQSDFEIGADIHNQLQKELKNSIVNLSESEKKLAQLQEEVEKLKLEVRKQRLLKSITKTETKSEELNEIEVEVPLDLQGNDNKNDDKELFEIVESSELENSNENKEEDCEKNDVNVVDLTVSDEDEKPARKLRSQGAKMPKSTKKVIRNT